MNYGFIQAKAIDPRHWDRDVLDAPTSEGSEADARHIPVDGKDMPTTDRYRCFNVVEVVTLDECLHRRSSIHCMEKSAAVLRIRVVEVIVSERWKRRALRWQGEDVGRLRQGRQAPLEIGSNIDITDGQVANNDVADPIQAQPLPFDCSGRANADHRFEGVIFAGDAIAIARADLVWIDHNQFTISGVRDCRRLWPHDKY